jgi:peroxiredoxin (alkyl hydroperoxide reductase subunit C)
MKEQKESCVKPAKGPIAASTAEIPAATASTQREVDMVTAKVGKPAPDFEANAFVEGGFKSITLSEFKGQWVVLCFYPGDYTFV